MDTELWRKRVTVTPNIHHGDPCIKGTRIPVAVVVGTVAEGLSHEQIIEHYPQLTREDIQAALQYAAVVMQSEIVAPLGKD